MAYTENPYASPSAQQDQSLLLPAALGAAGLAGAVGTGAYAVNQLHPQILNQAASSLSGRFGTSALSNPASAVQRMLGGAGANASTSTAARLPGALGSAIARPTTTALLSGAAPAATGGAVQSMLGQAFRPASSAVTNPITGRTIAAAGKGARFLRGGVGGAAGLIGSQLLGNMDIGGANSIADSALTWGAAGAGIGSMAGPWGALAGGVAGGVGGALASAFGIGQKEAYDPQERMDVMDRVSQALGIAGVPGQNRQEFMQSLNAQFALLDPDADDYDDQVKQLMEMVPGAAAELISQAPQLRQQQESRLTPEEIMGIQAQVGGFMNQYTQPMVQQAQALGGTLMATADSLPPAYRNAMNVQAQTLMSNATNMAAAYQSSAQMMPAFIGFEQQLANSYQQPAAANTATQAVDPAVAELLGLNQ